MIVFSARELAAVAVTQTNLKSRFGNYGLRFVHNQVIATNDYAETKAIDTRHNNDGDGRAYHLTKDDVVALRKRHADYAIIKEGVFTVYDVCAVVLYENTVYTLK